MKLIDCDSSYAQQILDIFNHAILNSRALWEYQPRTMAHMEAWYESKTKHNLPVIGLIDEQNQLLGFGSYGSFRDKPAYKYTIEHSLYIHPEHRGKGLGKILLPELIKRATQQDYHCMVAGIDSTNDISIKLHKAFGFEFCGRIKQSGYKFGGWLDLDFYQLLLSTPQEPNEKPL